VSNDVITPSETAEEPEIVKIVDLGCCVKGIETRETALLGMNSASHIYNDFIITLNSDKLVYSATDIIRIWGTLEYIGGNEAIEIWHGCPFMLFSIIGGKFGSGTYSIIVDILASSVLERGMVYHFEYQNNIAWSTDDPNAEYWESFINEPDLQLTVNEYTIILNGMFSLSERTLESKSGLRTELIITVTQ
jgi:hypothetical protein